MDYEEVVNGYIIDEDTSKFFDLNGISIKYSDNYILPYFLKAEYAYGKTEYIGQTQNGSPLNVTQKNVYILNLEGGIHILSNPFYLSAGYRFWNRGKSNYEGDYNEKYYWSYLGFGYLYLFYVFNINFKTDIEY